MYFDGLLSGHERKEWKQSYLHLFSSSRVLPPLRSPSEFFRFPSLSLGISYRGALIASSEVRTLHLSMAVTDLLFPGSNLPNLGLLFWFVRTWRCKARLPCFCRKFRYLAERKVRHLSYAPFLCRAALHLPFLLHFSLMRFRLAFNGLQSEPILD